MASSIFLERNLGDIPVFPGRGRRSSLSRRGNNSTENDTYIVNISPVKPGNIPEAPPLKRVPRQAVFKEVRRKLAFQDEEPYSTPLGFDFTDKMAAFRELLKRDAQRDSEKQEKARKHFSDLESHICGDHISDAACSVKERETQSENNLPKSKEAKALLSRMADEELARMSYINYEAQQHLESTSASGSGKKTEKIEKTNDDFLNKFLSNQLNKTDSNSKSSNRKSSKQINHQYDEDLDKIPQRESQSDKMSQNNQVPGLSLNETSGSMTSLVRKTGKGSIQSNVPHYHPSFVTPREPPSDDIKSLSKQPNSKGLGLCEGVRTGEVIYTKSRSHLHKTTSNGKHRASDDADSELLMMDDPRSTPRSNKSRSQRKKLKEKQHRSEEKIRKNIKELKEDLKIDSENGNKRVRGSDTKMSDTDTRSQETRQKQVFGPRYPEDGRKKIGSEKSWKQPAGSVNGSVRSVASQTSTAMAVELLRKLYNVDPTTRQDLVLKAKCFRRWLKNVQAMQSIDEKLSHANSPQELYVQGRDRGLNGLASIGSAVIIETDSDDAFFNFQNRQNSRNSSSGTEFIRYDTKCVTESTPTEKISKVAPITKENLERHTQIVQSNARTFASIGANEGRSAFTIVRPNAASQNKLPSTPRSVTRGNNTGENVNSNPQHLVHAKFSHLEPESSVQLLSDNLAHAFGGNYQSEVCAASKCVSDSARIARGLGRAMNVVVPSMSESLQLLDTANYGVCLQSAEIFQRYHMRRKFFSLWKRLTAERAIVRAADNLHRLHSLKKGLNAFKWAINRSRIMVDILQAKMKGVHLASTFYKWRDRAINSRQVRLRSSFCRWRHFTAESQKIRQIQESIDRKILRKVMAEWKYRFCVRVKENTANNHFRRRILTVTLTGWRIYSLESKEKQKRDEMARALYSERLQSKMFTNMVVLFRKVILAKNHYRNQYLHKLVVEWRRASIVSRSEHQMALVQSQEHWKKTTLHHYFIQWHDLLLTKRTCTAANKKLVRNAFIIWKKSWEHNVHYREEIQAQIRHKMLMSTMNCWRENVAVLKKRREAAVVFLQRVLVRHSLHGWRNYTRHKKQLRLIQERFTKNSNNQTLRKFLLLWKQKFEDRLDIHRAKTFWSNTCARKSVVQWRTVCHKRSLQRLFNETEVERQRNRLRTVFKKWLSVKETIECENNEVFQTKKILERSQLERHFYQWKEEMLLRLKIRPLINRRQTVMLTQYFQSWHLLMEHKKECRKNQQIFLKSQMRISFNAWRQLYLLHQLEVEIKNKMMKNFVRRCVSGWRAVIKRKRDADKFHSNQLLSQTFTLWYHKAIWQMRQRIATKEEKEYNISLLRTYFDLWCTHHQQQQLYESDIINQAEENRQIKLVTLSFMSWRHHLRTTLVAREHKKIIERKMLLGVIREWKFVAERNMKRAVHEFAVSIGLQTPEEFSGDTASESADSETADKLQLLTDMIMASENTSGIHSPVASSTLGTPMKKLFSPALSRVSLDLDRSIPEVELKPSIINTSFIDARFEMEQAVKTERMKTLVITAVKRIQFWPTSIVFDHWREYTVQQRSLRAIYSQVSQVLQKLQLQSTMKTWKTLHTNITKAKNFRDENMKQKVFTALQDNRRKMKYKKQLSALAHSYNSLTVFRKIFPVWFEKAQEKRHTEKVVHLWNTVTEEEQKLLPLERTFQAKLHGKTLTKCFTVWYMKFLQIDNLRRVYGRIIVRRCFECWYDWAQKKCQLRQISSDYCNKRLQKWAFHTWILRQQQKSYVIQKVKDIQVQQQRQIMQSWHHWTVENRCRKRASQAVIQSVQSHLVARVFTTWRSHVQKCQQVTLWCQQRLMIRVLQEWHDVTMLKRQQKQKVLSFQVTSYTRQVVRMFKLWHSQYLYRLRQHEEHEAYINRKVIQCGRLWKKKAQKSRGRRLYSELMQRKVQKCFSKWKYGYHRNLERENQLNKYIVRKNRNLLGMYLDNWKIRLLSDQATKHFSVKLLSTFFSEWHLYAAASRQRTRNCAVYQKALAQRTLKSYFHYWGSLTRVQNDIKKHCHLKLQIRVLREWHIYAHRRRQLSTLGAVLTKHISTNRLCSAWYTMKTQADYCRSLSETASKVVKEKNHKCMMTAMAIWRERLNRAIAGQFYQHLLAIRTVNRWHQFVDHKKQERELDRQMNEMATRHYNNHICKVAFRVLHNEVKVKHQLQRHKDRLLLKYGHIWKLRVDMMYTATCINEEKLLLKSWTLWRVELAKSRAAEKVSKYNERQILSQTFLAWKRICFQKINTNRKLQQIAQRSTDSPTFRPSQLPTPINRSQTRINRKN